MKSISCVVLVLLCCVFTAMAVPAQTEKRNVDTTSADVDSLLRESRDAFKQILAIAKMQYEEHSVSLDGVLQASIQLLDAELQLVTSRDERVRLHEKRVKNFKELEDVARRGHDAGTVTMKKVLLAKTMRIHAEIDLLQEKAQSD